MSYRRERLPEKSIKYWLLPEIQGLIKSGRIEGYFQSQPVAITPTHVTLARGGERFDVPADFVLALIGYEQDNTLFKLAGIELRGDCGAPVFNEQTMETTIPGIYVAGHFTNHRHIKPAIEAPRKIIPAIAAKCAVSAKGQI